MKKIPFLLLIVLILSYYNLSFASSREQAINETLTLLELRSSQKKITASQDPTIWDVKLQELLEENSLKQENKPTGNLSTYPKEDPSFESGEKTQKRKSYVSFGYNANHMHYKEVSGQDTLDEDYGKLKGFYFAAGYRSDDYYEYLKAKPFIQAYYKRFDGKIIYDGASGLGPFTFNENNEVHRYGL
ncbi:MAG: hypothetical protein KKC42_01000, partial [Candidatus Omnitrophica bacterium]|nr:hypothetical protein [Candidatus Omnitrophota bacterium]